MAICPTCKVDYTDGEKFCPTDGVRLMTASQVASALPSDPLIGSVLADRYRLLKVLGAGGMGVVYEAEHLVIEKHVAIKVLRPSASENPDVVARFRQEAKSASRIGHANIIDISDFGVTPFGSEFLVMELLKGEDLSDRLARDHTLSVEAGVNIINQCCKALGAAHDKGIIHRDLKPENVFLIQREEQPDFVKIVDFGIAKMSDLDMPGAPGRRLTKTGMIFGTPEYMSPEQAHGRTTDNRADIYSLGVIMYEMFAGRVPFVGQSFMAVLTAHMLDPPLRIRSLNESTILPVEVENVIMRALEKDPDDRPQTMADFAMELQGAVAAASLAESNLSSGPNAVSSPETAIPLVRPAADTLVMGGKQPSKSKTPGPVATATPVPEETRPRRGGGALAFGVFGVGLVAAGIGGYVLFQTQNGRNDTSGNEAVDAAVVIAELPDATAVAQVEPDDASTSEGAVDAALAVATPDASAVDVAGTVEVEILSQIRASVEVDGTEVCGRTPCTIELPIGVEAQFVLKRGAQRARRVVTPSSSTTQYRFVLRLPGGDDGSRGTMTMDGLSPDDLRHIDWEAARMMVSGGME